LDVISEIKNVVCEMKMKPQEMLQDKVCILSKYKDLLNEWS